MRKRWVVFVLFVCFAAVIPGAFLIYTFRHEPILSDPHNPAVRTEPRGQILDRNGVVLAVTLPDGSRRYPLGAAAAVTGYVDKEAGIGGGLERAYGTQLIGKKRSRLWYFSGTNETGDGLRTTLDARLLRACDAALGDVKGMVVVMNTNGELLTVVWHPAFDPNTVGKNWQTLRTSGEARLVNKTVQGFYPPGSVWKIIDALQLLDRSDRGYVCGAGVRVGEKTFRCPHPHGRLAGVKEAFAKSCNSYFISRGMEEIGRSDFTAGSKLFSGRELDGNLARKEYALALIGQGPVTLSPMEGAVLAATIANDGKKPQPAYLKKEVSTAQVIPEEKARRMQSLMQEVVLTGTGRGLADFVKQGHTLGLKTGTAVKDLRGGQKTNIAWVVGFAGKDKTPQMAFAIVVEDTDLYAAEACLPILRKILQAYVADQKGA